jgi:UDP-glucose 4-epimerase
VKSSNPLDAAHPPPVPLGLTRPPRYLVTGGRGFIGTHLVRRLVAYGVDVHAVTRTTPPQGSGVNWWQADLADPTTTQRVVRDVEPDVVIHLASRVAETRDFDAVVSVDIGTDLATANLMTATTAVPCRKLVLVRSLKEQRRLQLRYVNPPLYEAVEALSATDSTSLPNHGGPALVVLRLAMVYGPGDLHADRLVPHVITSLLDGKKPSLGSTRRMADWVYIDDVVDALVAAAVEPAAAGMIMDIGTGVPVSVRDFMSKITEVMGSPYRVGFESFHDWAEGRPLIADPKSAGTYLNWHARVSLGAGIRATVDWHREKHRSRRGPV